MLFVVVGFGMRVVVVVVMVTGWGAWRNGEEWRRQPRATVVVAAIVRFGMVTEFNLQVMLFE